MKYHSMRPMPAGLESLPELALDLHWTWNHAADRLWHQLSPEVWESTRNPWLLLQTVSQRRLEACAADPEFQAAVTRARQAREEYLAEPTPSGAGAPPLVAYFCLEYGLAEALPLYSGGLGILAGDHLKTASDLGVPMVAVGLLYQEGYFRQALDADGSQRELYPANVPGALPIVAERDADGAWLSIPLALPGRRLVLRVWRAQVGRVPLLLLDCNDPLNSAADRGITSQLYGEGTETRLVQELVLGIGGWRALQALGYRPQVCHLNEGHAALVTLERARSFMREHGVGFHEALWATRAGNVFTTHTPVEAAFDRFPFDLVYRYGREYAADLGVDPQALGGLGRRDPQDTGEPFNMAYLAMRTCGFVNGVSQLHGAVSRDLLQPLFPRRPRAEVPVTHITNGVHMPSWDSAASDRLWTACSGKDRWRGGFARPGCALDAADDVALWSLATEQRCELIRYARARLARQLSQHGAEAAQVAAAAQVLDPNALTMGLARRFTAYKRPNLLLSDPARLARLLGSSPRPVQLIVAGKAHPRDGIGKDMVREWARFAEQAHLRTRVVFLEDYDIGLAQQLVQGVDLWINTPRPTWEACGTSGMKVLVNGGLNLSTRDGWWAEACAPEYGWTIGADGTVADDARDAAQLYELLEREIVPMFYERDAQGLPRAWIARMRASMSQLTPRFSSNRMLAEYLERAYRPAAAGFVARSADGARSARELHAWAERVRAHWHEIHFGNVELQPQEAGFAAAVQVYLGETAPDDVAVELYADGEPATVVACRRAEPIPGAANGFVYRAEIRAARPAADFTARIVPWHAQARAALELPLVLWRDAASR